MSGKRKISIEQVAEIARRCSQGEISISEAARQCKLNWNRVREWVLLYEMHGASAFVEADKIAQYSEELKLQAITEYLSGKGSFKIISAKFGLKSDKTLRSWVKVYNSGKGFGRKMSGGSRMSNARKTTLEERIEIVKSCLESGNNYGETAIKYDVSYQQVYTWVKKYRDLGEAGLEDRRGKRVVDQAPRTIEEELRIEIAKLKRELYITQVERDLLKKLEELERSDAFLE